jgi:hypothetical protein
MKYKVSTSSMQATVSDLIGVTPRVFYAPGIWEQIHYLVAQCSKEVGWLGLVEKIDNDYLITEIFVPEQIVNGAETDISSNAMAALALQLLAENKDPSKLRYWGHSHVNMAVSPSSTDETQVAEYLETCNYFIRGIYNKRSETKVDIYDRDRGVAYQCVTNSTCYLTKEMTDKLDALIKANVKERPAVTQTTTHYGGYQHTNNWQKKTDGTSTKTTSGAGNVVYVIGKGAREYVNSMQKMQ